jgi:pimeloyl-ACP methyl ester carboxylesterase
MLAFRFSRRMWVLRYSLVALVGLSVEASSWTAAAQNIGISFSGILSESYDACGYFGPGSGNLQGDSFTAVISYNSSDFTYYSQSNLWGANIGGAMTTSITVNGITQTIVTGSSPSAGADIYPGNNQNNQPIMQFYNSANPVNPRDDNPGISIVYSTNGALTNIATPPPPLPGGEFGGGIDFVNANGKECAEGIYGTVGNLTIISPFLLGKSGKELGDLDLNAILPNLQTPDSATALAADGSSAALVLFQVSSMDQVTFTTNNGTSLIDYEHNHDLLKNPPTPGKSTIKVTPISVGALIYAVAWLQSPPAIVTPNFAAPITITAQQDGGQVQQAYLPLAPPPVVLVHGIWGNEKSLANVKSYLTSVSPWQSQPGLVVPIHYTNDIPFDNAEPSEALGAEIHNILRSAIAQGIVVGRVDLIAHSMGGLVARHYSSLPDYMSKYDRTEGRFHTILTLDTPEAGTELAEYLYQHASDYYHSNGKTPSGRSIINYPKEVWNAACGSESPTVTVEACFADPKVNNPLSPAGQPLENGAVYSLIPNSQNLQNLPPPNIPNSLWLAVSAVRPQTQGTDGESALQFQLESLIAATYKDESKAPTITSILIDQGQDDVIVPLSSQTDQAPVGQVATIDGLAHSPPGNPGFWGRWFQKHVLGLSSGNVEDSAPVNTLIACWLETEGSAGCLAPKAQAAVEQISPTAKLLPASIEIGPVDRLSVQIPHGVFLAEPFELAMRLPTSEVASLGVTQSDGLGHTDDQPLKIDHVRDGIAYAQVTPVFPGPVKFSVDAEFKDGSYSSKSVNATVSVPDAAPISFHADFNNWDTFYLGLAEGGNVGELHPVAVYASAPDRKISLDGHVQYSLISTGGDSVIQLRPDGSFKALHEGTATIEVHLGQAITHVKVVVEDD